LEDTDHRVDAAREPEIDAEPTLKRIKIVLKVIDPIKRREGLKRYVIMFPLVVIAFSLINANSHEVHVTVCQRT